MWDWFINFLTMVLEGLHGVSGDWGLAVIILTLIIRLILTPLQTKSVKSTANMQIMQPKIQEIQEKYADDPVRMQEEQIEALLRGKLQPAHRAACLSSCRCPSSSPSSPSLKNVACWMPPFFGILPSISDSVAGVLAASGWAAAAPYIIFDLLLWCADLRPHADEHPDAG